MLLRKQTPEFELARPDFLAMLAQNEKLIFTFFQRLSDRLYYKYIMLFNNSSADPMVKIRSLMDYYRFPLTRQQIANLTGLRVETVIRAVKKMEQDGILKIEGGQILY
ncbi:Crp/Fnr family transcriptional regulator [Chryseobacterium gallinarum]|uniref:Crp/Fnr family transcriptional regulator n=1 Tax=Chryseobacterium gallinarum TaxID=1324352 RepID=UPI001E3DF175|nr:helix-turn-helix domain-containing protein [Chryseobacterium gallinarum]